MPLAVLLNPDDPIYNFEHQMQHREYFSVMNPITRFSALPYQLDNAVFDIALPAADYNLRHQLAHNDFNRTLPSNYNDGYYLETVTPIPPPTPPPPPYDQAGALAAGQFGVLPEHILLEGVTDPENIAWWTFLNHQEHYAANEAILPLPTTQPTTAGSGPGQETVSNPWWWATVQPTYTGPFW